ncbi:MAG: hypothetical protein KF900_10080 [Bacteroidetes bacterium]|nr:hypothetical protein [Bacteroidota bacterium]
MEKKIIFSAALIAIAAITANAQETQHWTTDLMTVGAADEAKLGTENEKPLNFYTKGEKRTVIDTNGKFTLLRYANSNIPDNWGNRRLYVNKFGVITTSPHGGGNGGYTEGDVYCTCDEPCNAMISGGISPTSPCLNNTPQAWFEGGNILYTDHCGGSSNIIGTCNSYDFVMKANDTSAIFLKTDGRVNIGANNDIANNATTAAQLDISGKSVNQNSGLRDHLRIYGDNDGNIESTTGINLYFEGADNDFRIHRGNVGSGTSVLSILGTNSGGGVYINDFVNVAADAVISGNTAIGGDASVNGNVGIGGDVGIDGNIDVIGAASIAGNLNVNNRFSVASSTGYTEIKVYSPLGMPTPYGATNPRVLTVRDMNASKDLFAVTSAGMVYAREVEVNLTTNFPDYVFDKDYKLPSIPEMAKYIEKHKRLQGFEKGEYYEKNGINVNQMFVKQQEKIEELTLYIIQLEKRLSALEKGKK